MGRFVCIYMYIYVLLYNRYSDIHDVEDLYARVQHTPNTGSILRIPNSNHNVKSMSKWFRGTGKQIIVIVKHPHTLTNTHCHTGTQ